MHDKHQEKYADIQADNSLEGEIRAFVNLMSHLRKPDGCPWDRKQTHQSLRPYLLEETYEVIECIDNNDLEGLKEELGDLLLQIVFHAQIASEKQLFEMKDVIRMIREKLIERHPHIFADLKLETALQVRDQWEKIKLAKPGSSPQPNGTLKGVPKALPALTRAFRVQEKMAGVGFDWDTPDGAIEAFKEEVTEFIEALNKNDRDNVEEEIGDMLFSIVNTARLMGFGAEEALRKSTEKVINRFKSLEDMVRLNGESLTALSLEEMDKYWDQAKEMEKKEEK